MLLPGLLLSKPKRHCNRILGLNVGHESFSVGNRSCTAASRTCIAAKSAAAIFSGPLTQERTPPKRLPSPDSCCDRHPSFFRAPAAPVRAPASALLRQATYKGSGTRPASARAACRSSAQSACAAAADNRRAAQSGSPQAAFGLAQTGYPCPAKLKSGLSSKFGVNGVWRRCRLEAARRRRRSSARPGPSRKSLRNTAGGTTWRRLSGAGQPWHREFADEEIPVRMSRPLHVPRKGQVKRQSNISRNQLIGDRPIIDAMDGHQLGRLQLA